jgi:putative ABC transport system permease protein
VKLRALGQLVMIGWRGRRWIGTLLFVLVVSVAAAAIVAGLETRRSAARTWDAAFERAGAPHVIVSATAADALIAVTEDPRVERSSAPIAQTGAQLVRGDERADLVFRAARADALPTVGAPFPVAGRLAAAPGEVALEKSVASDQGIAVGASITVLVGERPIQYGVVGLVLDFQDCFFPQCDTGVAWVDPSGLPAGGTPWFTALLRLRDPSTAAAVSADMLRSNDRIEGVQDWLDTRRDALVVDEFFGAFLAGFGTFVLIAAGIVVAASVANRVLARRRDIGLAKAVGVTPGQFVVAITVEHLVLGAVGLAIGCAIGALLTPELRISVTKVLESDGATLHGRSVVFAVIALSAITVVATAAPALRIARATTAATLRPPRVDRGRSRLADVAATSGAGPVVVTGLKDSFGRRIRATLTGLSVVLGIVALLVTLGLHRSVGEVNGHPALAGDPWDVTVSPLDDTDPDTTLDLIRAVEGVRSAYFESSSRRVVDGEVVLVRAVGGRPDDAEYVVRDGRRMTDTGEAMGGYGLLERLGKHVGDTVTVDVEGTQIPVIVVGRYAETEDSGEVLLVRWETFAPLFPQHSPETYLVTADDDVSRGELASRLRDSFGSSATVEALVVESDDLDAFFVAFWLVAVLVLTVAFANLGSTVLLGVRERSRELGVLRTIGFTPTQLISSTAAGTAALVGAALLVAVPSGILANELLTRTVGRAMGYGPELGESPALAAGTIAVAAVAACAIAIALVAAATAARKSASDLIRYE